MISSHWYRLYKILLSSTPLFKKYIRSIYRKTTVDFDQSDIQIDYAVNNFTALLCGTAGEKTSLIFVEHMLNKNLNAHIIILDIGDEQIAHSKKHISKTFPQANIAYHVCDARNTSIESNSVDFIDTDFMFEYLDDDGVDAVLAEWKRILKPSGRFAFRMFAFRSQITVLLIKPFYKMFELIFRSHVFPHQLDVVTSLLNKHTLKYKIAGKVFVPFGYRFIGST